MTTRLSKPRTGLGALALVVLSLSFAQAQAAQPDGNACPLSPPGAMPQSGTPGTNPDITLGSSPQVRANLEAVRQALAAGRITPYQAGWLARQQWELARFQAGFRDAGAAATPSGSGACPVNGELGSALGGMARDGLRNAGNLMRQLMRETEQLLADKPVEHDL